LLCGLLPRPPTSMFFPYTTLFRSKSRGMCGMHVERVRRWGDPNHVGAFIKGDDHARFWSKVERGSDAECWLWRGTLVEGYGQFRSEEHTSELQSRENLVCRLLLEK